MDRLSQMMMMGAAQPSGEIDPFIDPFFSSVSLLVNADGQANASTTILDKSPLGQTLTASNASVSTSVVKFGSGSLNLTAASSRVDTASNSANNVGTGDFTIEAWVHPSAVQNASWGAIYVFGPVNDDGLYQLDDTLRFYRGGTVLVIVSALSANVWTHVAATRASGTLRIFVDGVASSSTTLTYDFARNAGRIGANLSGGEVFNGYVDDLRLTKGVARYTGNFTPPGILPTQ